MNEKRMQTWSLFVLSAAAVPPLAAACGGGNSQPANSAATASMGTTGQAPPPGYPAAAPPPGYPTQGYAQSYPPPQPSYAPAYPPPGPQQPAYPQQAAPPPVAAQPAPAASQAPPLAPTDPNSLQGILQGLQTALQGTVVAGTGGVPNDLTDAGLKALALRVAPGMQPEGDELKQNLTQGQHAVMMVTLQAGKCYTLLGYSVPGAVQDLDLNLLAPPLYMTLAGQDLTHTSTPVIGGSPNPMCPVVAFPLQYKLDVFARQGSGAAAVQLYSKTK
jgi:hypothetical protein